MMERRQQQQLDRVLQMGDSWSLDEQKQTEQQGFSIDDASNTPSTASYAVPSSSKMLAIVENGDDGGAEQSQIQDLKVKFVDQDELESDAGRKAEIQINTRDIEIEESRLKKAKLTKFKTGQKIEHAKRNLESPNVKVSSKTSIRIQLRYLNEEDTKLTQDIHDIEHRIEGYKKKLEQFQQQDVSGPKNPHVAREKQSDETDRDFLVRTGKITPFHDLRGLEKRQSENIIDEDSHTTELSRQLPQTSQKKQKKDDTLRIESVDNESENVGIYDDFVDNDNDDGDDTVFYRRFDNWIKQRLVGQDTRLDGIKEEETSELSSLESELALKLPHPKLEDKVFDGDLRVPGEIFSNLFDYQKTCVQWLWELYCQKAGGIIGDEMGLGKTIQIVAFLASLHHSGMINKPILIVCPATVMRQWVNEIHVWWPPFRAVILHSIGAGMVNGSSKKKEGTLSTNVAKSLVESVKRRGNIIVTTYSSLRNYSKILLPIEWGYCVLDEGHNIRNPAADITLTCKQIRTHNRIILSGTPIQNNLNELWSLFDFVFPGRLGTLPVFQAQFATPINIGGYANASNVQVQTGYKCACVLRDLINPYLLRRMKSDVASDLPKKKEQVLFCKLTKSQRKSYEDFLNSKEMDGILAGKRDVLYGIDILRKICNHPDLVYKDILIKESDPTYGDASRSGKMQVIKSLIKLWKRLGHRTLLFTQTVQMLNILEKFVVEMENVKFVRMDGTTPIAQRQSLISRFNNDKSLDLFLLTTRVGGLGINLVGADRVIIFDPDWNPSTDIQARERAWRLGQKRSVSIFRLMCSGTIEEKIYHRQIFKQFLTNKILKDPKQRRFFKMHDLRDLFTLGEDSVLEGAGTETGDLFLGAERIFKHRGNESATRIQQNQTGENHRKKKSEVERQGIQTMKGFSKIEPIHGQQNLSNDNPNSEDYVLESIFASSAVQSALEHDRIMEADKPADEIVRKEANRVAEQAKRAIFASSRNMMQDQTSSKFVLDIIKQRKKMR